MSVATTAHDQALAAWHTLHYFLPIFFPSAVNVGSGLPYSFSAHSVNMGSPAVRQRRQHMQYNPTIAQITGLVKHRLYADVCLIANLQLVTKL